MIQTRCLMGVNWVEFEMVEWNFTWGNQTTGIIVSGWGAQLCSHLISNQEIFITSIYREWGFEIRQRGWGDSSHTNRASTTHRALEHEERPPPHIRKGYVICIINSVLPSSQHCHFQPHSPSNRPTILFSQVTRSRDWLTINCYFLKKIANRIMLWSSSSLWLNQQANMSFGFSVSDIVSSIQLAHEIYKAVFERPSFARECQELLVHINRVEKLSL